MANEAIRVKALDLSHALQHALLAGQKGVWWVDYDPTECAAYRRLEADFARRVGEEATEAMQDARRSTVQTLTQKCIEKDEEMRALKARYDKLEAASGRAYAAAMRAANQLEGGAYTVANAETLRSEVRFLGDALRSVVEGGE